jgi:NAD(P)H-nitrite reductase large subunit
MRHLIIGNSAAGTAAAEAIRATDPQADILLVSQDNAFYSRCQLHLVATGQRSAEQANFLPGDWAQRHQVNLLLGCTVTGIDAEARQALCADGQRLDYDRLLLASGSRSFLPPVEGLAGPGTCGLRNIDDALQIRNIYRDSQHVVIIGAGLVGCELAEALIEVGHPSVSLVEMAPHPLPLQLETVTGERLRQLMQQSGVNMYCGDGLARVERAADGRPLKLHLQSGTALPVDLIIAAAGVRANTELLSALGAECQRGIVIDQHCQTSLPDIYAAGDVTECQDSTLQRIMPSAIWPAARKQGRVAGINMAAGDATLLEHTGLRASVSLFGTSMVSVGPVFNIDPAWNKEFSQHTDSRGRLCTKVCYTDEQKVLTAAVLCGDVSQAGLYASAIIKKLPLGDLKPASVPDHVLAAAV